MLDAVRPWGGTVRAYRSPAVVTTVCNERWQLDGYWALRRQIFVNEQSLFELDDRDEHDDHAHPIVSLSTAAGMADQVVGIVRIYQQGANLWFGGRLGVCQAYRRHGVVGERLIKTAVGTARALGCETFLATVQAPNVRYFERHRFDVVEPIVVCGQPHSLMRARVDEFLPLPLPADAVGGYAEAAA